MRRIVSRVAVTLALVLVIAFSVTYQAHAARQVVKNVDCRGTGRAVVVRDGAGHRWTLQPGQAVNMAWGGRQVWVPYSSYVFKGSGSGTGCRSAWALAPTSGYWKSFGWTGVTINFSTMGR